VMSTNCGCKWHVVMEANKQKALSFWPETLPLVQSGAECYKMPLLGNITSQQWHCTTERCKETNCNYADDFKDVSAVTGIRKTERSAVQWLAWPSLKVKSLLL
jgi:hypothetical protein